MWLHTGSGEKVNTQVEVIYQLKQKVEELRSENEKLRHENLMIKKEGTFDMIPCTVSIVNYQQLKRSHLMKQFMI